MAERESTARTLGVSALIAVGCALMVSASVAYLRPLQTTTERLERQRDIVTAAGLIGADEVVSDEAVRQAFERVEARLVDLDTATLIDEADPLLYDLTVAATNPETSVGIGSSADSARLNRRPRRMPVYLLRDGATPSVVLTIYGTGMWSTIEGYLAVSPGDNRLESLIIHSHGETPGVGDRIENPTWLAAWSNRPLRTEGRAVRFRLGATGGVGEADQSIEGISGATLSAAAVVAMVNYWLGPDAYGPFLERLSDGSAAEPRP